MILNSGLDAACTNDPINAFTSYAAIGTDSSAPAASQTTLGAQVGSRSNSNGGFVDVDNAGLDDTNDIIWFERTRTRVFAITSNVNLTEWGTALASSGNLSVRELFRTDPLDNGSSAITLTLENGDELQLVIKFRMQATWEYESKTFVITGTAGNDANGAHTGKATVSSGNSSNTTPVLLALVAITPSYAPMLLVYNADQSSVAKNANLGAFSAYTSTSLAAYTPGNYYRDCVATFATSAAVGDHYAWAAAYDASGNAQRGHRFLLTSPTKLTKASTHKLTLTVRKTIARL